jgi:hypothetical protein
MNDGAGDLPASYAQEQLWLADRLAGSDTSYVVGSTIVLNGPLDEDALAAAVRAVVDRHEALRTTFTFRNGGLVQQIRSGAGVVQPLADLSAIDVADQSAALEELARGELMTAFDLEQGPLTRATIVRLGSRRHALLLTMHHIVIDRWSRHVLLDDLAELYDAHVHGRPSTLEPLALQYADWAVWQRELSETSWLRDDVRWWRDTLADAPRACGIGFGAAPSAPRAEYTHFVVDPPTTARLRAFAADRGATAFMVLLAGFAALLHRATGAVDLVVGTPTANRGRPEIDRLAGDFINTLALRIDLRGDPGYATLVDRTRMATIAAYRHRHVPFSLVVNSLRPRERSHGSPLFDVALTFANEPEPRPHFAGLDVSILETPAQHAKFDLTFSLVDEGDVLNGQVEHDADRVSGVEQLVAAYVAILDSGMTDPARPVADLPVPGEPDVPRPARPTEQFAFERGDDA